MFIIRCLVMFLALTISPTIFLSSATNVSADDTSSDISGFVIIGEAEKVTFTSKDLRLNARIDTGAQTSSLGVVDQQPFERDGKKWLDFSVQDPDSGNLIDFKMPVVRIAEIKRHGAAAQERYVVKLKIKLGDIEMEREFTLADRARYTFPVLIGRNVLSGKYLVDVNRKYSTSHSGGKEE
ncbi:MAG: ATP-dependent zinc protease [Desulfuromonadales bacterium]|nr:ATP-dependent zinc protease [Desulfuromonadales bacterium]